MSLMRPLLLFEASFRQTTKILNVFLFLDILRKYPMEYKEIIQVINSALDYITEADAKVFIFHKKTLKILIFLKN